ncbi:DUF2567 domain-containing protein [Streptomyces sp. NPDC056987]|uniref:DUF2567 domain-containing protein n=1 Tax=Streptomyces sp. NPDC056987 TaxID=3345988 RepID=UPI0036455C8E
MTAPLTPPHQPQHDDPWQTPSAGVSPDPAADAEKGPDMKTEMRQAAVVLAALMVSGLLLGLLWVWLAPRVPLVSNATAVYLKDTEGEEAIAADGTFLLLALAFGAVAAGLVFLLHRSGGIALVVGLALGGLLGSVVAWKFGASLGPTSDVVAHAKQVGKGVTFEAPLELQAKGALLAWPIAAMVVHLALTGLFGPRDPEPEWEWHTPYGAAPQRGDGNPAENPAENPSWGASEK